MCIEMLFSLILCMHLHKVLSNEMQSFLKTAELEYGQYVE